MIQLKTIIVAVTIAVLCIVIQTVSAEWVHPIVGGAIEVSKVAEGAYNEVKKGAEGLWNGAKSFFGR